MSARQTVQATVTTDGAITKVTAATVEWGYTNFYRYHWAGRADAAAAAGNDSLWNMDQVGTNYGSEKDADDWVGVTKVELPIATGEFSGGSSAFTAPPWAGVVAGPRQMVVPLDGGTRGPRRRHPR
ncbi:hypothetical protein [Mycobacterium sp.]|uniref:hypothetical protein n=1 Tax=Mycobacterium sp. TaxID=1785 RepID=UPI0033412964